MRWIIFRRKETNKTLKYCRGITSKPILASSRIMKSRQFESSWVLTGIPPWQLLHKFTQIISNKWAFASEKEKTIYLKILYICSNFQAWYAPSRHKRKENPNKWHRGRIPLSSLNWQLELIALSKKTKKLWVLLEFTWVLLGFYQLIL